MSTAKRNNLVSQLAGKVPLRIMIVIPFVLLVSLAGALTGYLSLRNGQEAVNNVASQLRQEMTSRIQERVQAYLETAHLVNQLNSNAIQLGQVDLTDKPSLEKYFWTQIRSFDEVTNTFVGLPDGEFYGARGLGEGKARRSQIIVANETTRGSLNYYDTDAEGKRTALLEGAPNYDPRQRDWYKDAIKARQPIWSSIYPEFATKALAITAAQPVYDSYGNLVGVLGGTAILSYVNEFLNSLEVGKTGQTFIIERSGELVATSNTNTPVVNVTQSRVKGDKVERIEARESENPIIRITAEHLTNQFGNLGKIKDIQQLNFNIDNEKHFVQVTPVSDERGLDWLIVVMIPEADFMEQINANTRITILLSLVALALTALIGLLTARGIIQPILRLNAVTKKFAEGDWDQQLQTSRNDELGELAQSFNIMGQQLKKYFVELEDANESLERRVQERTRELAQALEELKSSQAQLVQSEKMASLGQMVAGVAHEINTPLGYVRSNVDMTQSLFLEVEELVNLYDGLVGLLISDNTSEEDLHTQMAAVVEMAENFKEDETFSETQALFKDVLFGLDQISDLVLNLKDFSRMDQAKVDNVNINESLDSVLVIGHHVMKDVSSINKHYSDVPLIQCSPSHVNQVLLNILTNAAQAVDKGTGIIDITTHYDNDYVHIEMQDNGQGIPEDVKEKIFDPFFTTKAVGEGTGLGLSISFQIIEQHNGKIAVESEVGKGTKFMVSLPRQIPDAKS